MGGGESLLLCYFIVILNISVVVVVDMLLLLLLLQLCSFDHDRFIDSVTLYDDVCGWGGRHACVLRT